jgi:hypothetical protein
VPVDPKECRKNALQCTELAEQAKDPKQATILKNLAERWLKAAIELERVEALRDELSSVLKER